MTLLIVDDDQDIRDSLQDFFEDKGFEVATAANGVEALDVLGAERSPCDPRLAQVPVIVSTSDPSRAPSGVLTLKKPIDLGTLLHAVRQHCVELSPRAL
jgi:hypothetical protein